MRWGWYLASGFCSVFNSSMGLARCIASWSVCLVFVVGVGPEF
jgi:hypothetical protein